MSNFSKRNPTAAEHESRLLNDTHLRRGRLRVGVSSCLLGNPVRYDGGHKKSHALVHAFAAHAEFVSICPEMEIGLKTPREPIHLVAAGSGVRLVGVESGTDYTVRMERYARDTAERLRVDGFIFMDRSPSCGLSAVPVIAPDGKATADGRGIFAAVIRRANPELPVAGENELRTAVRAEAFLEHMRSYRKIRVHPLQHP